MKPAGCNDHRMEWISDIEDKIMENNEAEKKRERKLLYHEGRIKRELWKQLGQSSLTYKSRHIRLIADLSTDLACQKVVAGKIHCAN